MTEQEWKNLAKAIGNGVSKAEEQLAQHFGKRFGKSIFYVARHHGFSREEDAWEIYQDTFSALLIALRKKDFKEQSSFGTFVYGICKNQCKQRLTREHRDKRGGGIEHLPLDLVDGDHVEKLDKHFRNALQAQFNELLQSLLLHTNPLENYTARELLRIVQKCIQAMKNTEYRQVFELLLQGYKRNELSKTLKIPLKRVDEIKCHGKKLLKKCVKQNFS